MDLEEETSKFKGLLIVGVLFVVSGFWSCQEFKYLVRGTPADATVRQVSKQRIPFDKRHREEWLIEFSYSDKAGQRLVERETLPEAELPPADGQTLAIEYLPGADDSARFAGRRNYVAMAFFLGTLGVLAFFIIRLWREAAEYGRESARRREQFQRKKSY